MNGIGDEVIVTPDGGTDSNRWTKVVFGDHVVLLSQGTLQDYVPGSLTLTSKTTGETLSLAAKDPPPLPLTTIHDLPDKILLKVFMFLETKDLIGRCRFVSKRFRGISNGLCRDRFVKLNLPWTYEEQENDIFTLSDLENAPWSSLLVGYTTTLELKRKFLGFFGRDIWKLDLDVESYDEALELLYHTPNVRHLHVSSTQDGICEEYWSRTPLEGIGGFGHSLRHLTQLGMNRLTDKSVGFLKYLVTECGIGLDHFHAFFQVDTEETAEMVKSLLGNVSHISLTAHYNPSNPRPFNTLTSATGNLPVKELILGSVEPNGEVELENPCEPCQRFISAHANRLEKLSLDMEFSSDDVHGEPFPFMPLLKSLDITFKIPEDRSRSEIRFMKLLETNSFPMLEEVQIVDYWLGDLDSPRLYFPDKCHFDSVSKLLIYLAGRAQYPWNRIFPNLKSLTTNCSDAEGLIGIFSSHTLEELSLDIVHGGKMDLLNALFSGIPDPNASFREAVHERPSILHLTNLKILKIWFIFSRGGAGGEVHKWRDPGICLSLLKLQPLNLTLEGMEVSDEWKAKLKARHLSFTLN